MSEIYTRWDITSLPNGKARLRMETNDDDDDGYPDDEPVTVWEQDLSMKLALSMSGGKTHIGAYGQEVTVYLDGKEVTHDQV